ncbi:MAG: hypothetical protein IPH49_00245 [Ignavibacteria bacterium]|nr:hypothetical protein [Ignavibacteria bacterium]
MKQPLCGLLVLFSLVTLARADGLDRSTCPESLAWLVDQVEWVVPSAGPKDALRSRRLVVIHMREYGNSREVANAVMVWQAKSPSPNVEVLCVWSSISGMELTRQITTLPGSWSHVRDYQHIPGLLWSLPTGPAIVAAYNESGVNVWHVEADSTIGYVIDRWVEQGIVPPDPSLPINTVDVRRCSMELRASSPGSGGAVAGGADKGKRCWVRRANGSSVLRAVIEFLQPEAEVTNVAHAESTDTLYDLDLVVPATMDRARICDSLVNVLSSRFGLIAVHEEVSTFDLS